MATRLLPFGPPEIIISILQNCDTFKQVISLVSTCKHLHSLWLSHAPAIIWRLGQSSIPAFNYALMAVRATGIVQEAYQSGTQPPEISPIEKLSGISCLPQISELGGIFDLQHLVRCFEHRFFNGTEHIDVYPIHPETMERVLLALESPYELPLWKERFDRTLYILFLAGALFANAYHEPFFSETNDKPSDFLSLYFQLEAEAEADEDEDENGADWSHLSSREVQYLNRFTPYSPTPLNEDERVIFGPFAEWLIDDTKCGVGEVITEGLEKISHITRQFDTTEVAAIWEIMRIFAAFERFGDLMDLSHLNSFADGSDEDRVSPNDAEQQSEPPGGVRKVVTVWFGMFEAQEITMPALVKDAAQGQIIVNRVARLQKTGEEKKRGITGGLSSTIVAPATSRFINIERLLDIFREHYEDVNHREGLCPAPGPFRRLFQFILRNYFQLQFRDRVFEYWYGAPFPEFMRNPAIFCHRHIHRKSYDFNGLYGLEILEDYKPLRNA